MTYASPQRAATGARFDPLVPHPARVYNVWLGGKDGLAADRKAAAEVAACRPEVVAGARANRAFLARAFRYLAGPCGIRQFVDIGPGLPAPDATHTVAQAIAPESKIVYVANDPLVLAHARALKTGEGTAVINADLRDAGTILGHPDTRRLIDFIQPLAILFVAVFRFVGDHDACEAVARFTSAAAPGSYLVLSHGSSDPDSQSVAAGEAPDASTANPVTTRTGAEILAFFDGLEIPEPGPVPVRQWRPGENDPADPGTV